MSADLLRRAAAKMRENAEAADPANPRGWEAILTSDGDSIVDMGGGSLGRCPDCGVRAGFDAAEAEHIASWHPAVALAVADWLDHFAATEYDPNAGIQVTDRSHEKAEAVARAYLGEDA